MTKRSSLMAAAMCCPSLLLLGGCGGGSSADIYSLLEKAGQQEAAAGGDYERGKRELAAGEYGLAVESFSAEVARDPNSIRALNGEAIAYAKLGRADVAKQLFETALTIDRDSPETLSNLAYLHLKQGDPDGALVLAERAKSALSTGANDKSPPVLSVVLATNEALMRVPLTAQETQQDTVSTAALQIDKPDAAQPPYAAPTVPVRESPLPPAPQQTAAVRQDAVAVTPQTETAIATTAPQASGATRTALQETAAIPSTPRKVAATTTAPQAPVASTASTATPDQARLPAVPDLPSTPVAAKLATIAAPVLVRAATVRPAELETVPAAPRHTVSPPAPPEPAVPAVPAQPPAAMATPSPTQAATSLQAAAQTSGTKLTIANGSGRSWMAHRFKEYLASRGLHVGTLLNASSFGQRSSVLYYDSDVREAAQSVAQLLPAPVRLVEIRGPTGKMDLVVGTNLDRFDIQLAAGHVDLNKMAQR